MASDLKTWPSSFLPVKQKPDYRRIQLQPVVAVDVVVAVVAVVAVVVAVDVVVAVAVVVAVDDFAVCVAGSCYS